METIGFQERLTAIFTAAYEYNTWEDRNRADEDRITKLHALLRETPSLSFDDASTVACWCDSYSRLGAIVHMAGKMNKGDWFGVLGEWWTQCDNIAFLLWWLKELLPRKGPVMEMMYEEEREAFRGLPENLTVYRGCGSWNKKGASWTLDRDVALKFPFLNRYRVKTPLLITATVKKSKVLALKLGRNESEIITFSTVPFTVEPIPASFDPLMVAA